METLFTVLITLGVVAIIVTVVGVIRLMLRVKDLGHVRVEMECLQQDIQQQLDDGRRDFDQQITSSESNLDRRFDNIWEHVHRMDDVLNPNKDLIKN